MDFDTETFITEVFTRPVVWDQRNKHYHNRIIVDNNWKNIEAVMKQPSKYFIFIYNLCVNTKSRKASLTTRPLVMLIALNLPSRSLVLRLLFKLLASCIAFAFPSVNNGVVKNTYSLNE